MEQMTTSRLTKLARFVSFLFSFTVCFVSCAREKELEKRIYFTAAFTDSTGKRKLNDVIASVEPFIGGTQKTPIIANGKFEIYVTDSPQLSLFSRGFFISGTYAPDGTVTSYIISEYGAGL